MPDQHVLHACKLVLATFWIQMAAASASTVYHVSSFPDNYAAAAIAISPDGEWAVIADHGSDNSMSVIKTVNLKDGFTRGLAGDAYGFSDGTGPSAKFNLPYGLAYDQEGTFVLVADTNNNRIRKIVIDTRVVTTLAGSGTDSFADGVGIVAHFRQPRGIVVDMYSTGSKAYVADSGNNRIRQIIISTGVVTTMAGSSSGYADGTDAKFMDPTGIAATATHNFLLVADRMNYRIRAVDLIDNTVKTVAGTGDAGLADGGALTAAKFTKAGSIAIALDSSYALAAEESSCRIRKIELSVNTGTVSATVVRTFSGSGTCSNTMGWKGVATYKETLPAVAIDQFEGYLTLVFHALLFCSLFCIVSLAPNHIKHTNHTKRIKRIKRKSPQITVLLSESPSSHTSSTNPHHHCHLPSSTPLTLNGLINVRPSSPSPSQHNQAPKEPNNARWPIGKT